MDIELPVGTQLKILGIDAIVVRGRACGKCLIKSLTKSGACRPSGDRSICGSKMCGNISPFACSKDVRSDDVDVFIQKVE